LIAVRGGRGKDEKERVFSAERKRKIEFMGGERE